MPHTENIIQREAGGEEPSFACESQGQPKHLQIISRKDALALGLKRFFTGKPCKCGHVDERTVSDRCCVECKKQYREENKAVKAEYDRKYRAENKESRAEYDRKYYAENKAAKAEYDRKYYAENKEAIAERKRKYYAQNKDVLAERDRQYRAENKEAIAERGRQYYVQNKAVKAEYGRQYRAENKESIAEYQRAYRSENKEAVAESKRKYRAENPEIGRASTLRRRARKRNASGSHTAQDIKNLLTLQKGKCACCKDKLDQYHVDHVVPLAAGGTNDKYNLQILCPTCNMSKHAKHPIEFMQQRGFLL